MKKFKEGDTIRIKTDANLDRTYEVISVRGKLAHGKRSDDKAGPWASSFVLGRPEGYKLVNRPTKKDREIKLLQALVKESQDAYSELSRRREKEQADSDLKLLESGLVRIDLLRECTVSQAERYGDGFNEFAEMKLLVRNDTIREVLKRWVG